MLAGGGDIILLDRFAGGVLKLADVPMLPAELVAAGGAIDHLIIAARVLAGGGNQVLLDRLSLGVEELTDDDGLPAQLLAARRAVGHQIVAARVLAGGGDLVLPHGLAGSVTIGGAFDGVGGLVRGGDEVRLPFGNGLRGAPRLVIGHGAAGEGAGVGRDLISRNKILLSAVPDARACAIVIYVLTAARHAYVRPAADGDVGTCSNSPKFFISGADTRAAIASRSDDPAASDLDVSAAATSAAADARAIPAALSDDFAPRNGDVRSVSLKVAAADARAATAAGGRDRAAGDGDLRTGVTVAAADACAAPAAVGVHRAAGDLDLGTGAIAATADARAIPAAGGGNCAAGDGNVGAVALIAAADARAAFAAGGGEGAVSVFVADGQGAGALLLHARVALPAGQAVVPFQLDGHGPAGVDQQGGAAVGILFVRVLPGVDGQIPDDDVYGLSGFRIDGDGVGPAAGGGAGDDGGLRLCIDFAALLHLLNVSLGIDRDAALTDVIGLGQGAEGRQAQDQGQQQGKKALHVHRFTSFPGNQKAPGRPRKGSAARCFCVCKSKQRLSVCLSV